MIEIKIEDGMAKVYTPYNPDFVKRIKRIGGAKWNGQGKYWIIPEEAIEAARELMVDTYGYSDIVENETISLKVTFNDSAEEFCKEVVLFGKTLACAYGRDGGARVGDDVAYIKGEATSGGSIKNWKSIVKKGSVVLLTNVNKDIYEKAEVKYNVDIEVLGTRVNKKQLLEEKERLIKRIHEIDKLLEEV